MELLVVWRNNKTKNQKKSSVRVWVCVPDVIGALACGFQTKKKRQAVWRQKNVNIGCCGKDYDGMCLKKPDV